MPGIPFLDIAGVASNLLGGIFKGIQGGKQQRMANGIHPVNAVYNSSQYANNQLGAVSQAYNGEMPGAAQAQNNIDANQANSFGGVERNASNGSQALATLAGLQGNTNQAYNDLAAKQAQNKQGLLGELGMANQGMTNEGDKVYNDHLRNYNNDVAAKNALQNAAFKNKGAMVSDFGNALVGAGNAADQAGGGSRGGGSSYSSPQSSYGMMPQMVNSTGTIDPNYNPFI